MFHKVLVFKPFLFIFLLFTALNNLEAENGNLIFPSFFMKNQGQFSNGSQYCLKSARSNTFFFDNYIVNQFITAKKENDSINPDILNMRIDFENSNPHPTFEEKDPLTSKSNFFTGKDASSWKTDVASFATLAYKNLYDKIDLVYYNSAKGIKSDFVVHSGGNYSDITLKYSGVKDITINSQGVLEILTDAGEITEHIPEAYQVINGIKVLVNASFKIKNRNTIYFDVDDYNPDYDLVIDPQLMYCSYFGGNSDDKWPTRISRDKQQNIYFSGSTMSSNFPVTPGAFSTTYKSSDYDVFVMKLDSTGDKLIFSTFISSTGQDIAGSLKLVGASNDILLLGLAGDNDFPTTTGAYQTTYGGGYHDIFVLKLNNEGDKLIFSTLVGGATDEQISDFCLDKNGDIYVLGYAGYYFPTTPGAFQPNLSGDYDVCVFKLKSDGSKLLYSTFLGGTERDRSGGIAIDYSSNIYVSSWVMGNIPTTPGAYDNTFHGGIDIAVSKFDPTLSTLIFSTMIGGPGDDITQSDLFLDAANNITIVGGVGSGFPTTPGSFDQSYNGGNYDVAIIKVKNDGAKLLYSSYLGGYGDDFARNFTQDASGNFVITGSCGNGFPTTTCPYDDTFNGGSTDCFISKIDINSSSLLYSSYLGGQGNDEGFNIKSFGDTLYIAGTTSSPDLPVTSDAFDQTFNPGGNDVFLIKLLPGAGLIPVAKFNNPPVTCINQPTNFINNSLNSLTYSWRFADGFTSTAQDQSHSFSKPGNYIVSLISTNLCGRDTVAGSIKVEGFLTNKAASICYGDSLFVNGKYRLVSGNYNTTLSAISGCDSIITTNLLVKPLIQSIQAPSICEGDIFKVGVHDYSVAGNYTDILKAFSGCDSIVKTNLSVKPKIHTIQTPSICRGGKFAVGTHIYKEAGTYTDTFSAFSGCDSVVTTILTTKPIIQNTQNPAICLGETFAVGLHYYTSAGTYRDTLNTAAGCDSVIISNLTVNPIPNPSLGNDTLMCPGELIVLTPGIGFSKYEWSDGSDLKTLNVTRPGTYSVNVFAGLCSASDTISIAGCGIELWFPNVFTPNNDGLNEVFRPVAQGIITSYQITIFNRWGQKLYESNDPIAGWDGTFEGNRCPDGAYFFIAEYSVDNPKQRTTRGSVTLLR